MNISDAKKIIEPVLRRVMLFLGRSTITRVDDSTGTQRIQATVLAGETVDQIERLSEYGFSSVPLAGASAVILFAGGNRSHGVVIATDDARHRAHGLSAGEVCIYDAAGSKILLGSDGSITITPSRGTLTVNGAIAATGDVKAGSISLKSHVHSGVQSGGSNTGGPVS